MNGIDLLFDSQRDNAFYIQIGLNRPQFRAHLVSFIGLEAMKRQPVFLRIDGDRAKP